MKTIIKITLSLFVLLALLGSVFYFFAKEEAPASRKPADIASPGTNYRVPVSVAVVKKQTLRLYISTTGIAKARQKIALSTEIAGYLQQLYIQSGERVKAAAIIAQLQDGGYRVDYEQEASEFLNALGGLLAELRSNCHPRLEEWQTYIDRFVRENVLRPLPQSESLAEAIILTRLKVKACYFKLKKNQMLLEKCLIRAPFSGIISEIQVHEGAYLAAGTPLGQLVNLDQITVKTAVLEGDLPSITVGGSARITFPALPRQPFTGTVAAVDPLIDPESKSGSIYLRVDNPRHVIKDGSFAEVEVEKAVFPNRLLIPREALLVRNERSLIFRVKDQKARWEYVETGHRNDQWVEISGNVQPGDTVITRGHYALAHDAPVKIEAQ